MRSDPQPTPCPAPLHADGDDARVRKPHLPLCNRDPQLAHLPERGRSRAHRPLHGILLLPGAHGARVEGLQILPEPQ
eukprot:10466867-Heterocapsa_arctica.AAC.1